MFFTLSGFLITSLLLVEHAGSGRLSLRRFWARRARRLVPALLLTFPLVALVVRLSPQAASERADGRRGRAACCGSRTGDSCSPTRRTPTCSRCRRRSSTSGHSPSKSSTTSSSRCVALFFLGRAGKRAFATLLGILVVVSVALGTAMATHAASITRAYYGTDSRIGEILIGALLAVAVVRAGGPITLTPRLRHGLDAAALGALAVLGWLVTTLAYGDVRLFRGGLLLAAALHGGTHLRGGAARSLVSAA